MGLPLLYQCTICRSHKHLFDQRQLASQQQQSRQATAMQMIERPFAIIPNVQDLENVFTESPQAYQLMLGATMGTTTTGRAKFSSSTVSHV